jgi:hypothetical protein
MKRLLCAFPILATPLLFSCLREDQPKPSLEVVMPAKLETATFALG